MNKSESKKSSLHKLMLPMIVAVVTLSGLVIFFQIINYHGNYFVDLDRANFNDDQLPLRIREETDSYKFSYQFNDGGKKASQIDGTPIRLIFEPEEYITEDKNVAIGVTYKNSSDWTVKLVCSLCASSSTPVEKTLSKQSEDGEWIVAEAIFSATEIKQTGDAGKIDFELRNNDLAESSNIAEAYDKGGYFKIAWFGNNVLYGKQDAKLLSYRPISTDPNSWLEEILPSPAAVIPGYPTPSADALAVIAKKYPLSTTSPNIPTFILAQEILYPLPYFKEINVRVY